MASSRYVAYVGSLHLYLPSLRPYCSLYRLPFEGDDDSQRKITGLTLRMSFYVYINCPERASKCKWWPPDHSRLFRAPCHLCQPSAHDCDEQHIASWPIPRRGPSHVPPGGRKYTVGRVQHRFRAEWGPMLQENRALASERAIPGPDVTRRRTEATIANAASRVKKHHNSLLTLTFVLFLNSRPDCATMVWIVNAGRAMDAIDWNTARWTATIPTLVRSENPSWTSSGVGPCRWALYASYETSLLNKC